MTAVDATIGLRQRREAVVNRHAELENQHDIEGTIGTFADPRYEMNGVPADGADAVRELLQSLMGALPDLHASIDSMRHADDAVIVEARITGTHDGEWQGVPATGRGVDIPGVAIFEFDDDRLICEKVFFDMATMLTQIGVLPAVQG